MIVQLEDGTTSGWPAVSRWQLLHWCLVGNGVLNQLQSGEIKNTAQLEQLISFFITFFPIFLSRSCSFSALPYIPIDVPTHTYTRSTQQVHLSKLSSSHLGMIMEIQANSIHIPLVSTRSLSFLHPSIPVVSNSLHLPLLSPPSCAISYIIYYNT